jgi:hypothetical protein
VVKSLNCVANVANTLKKPFPWGLHTGLIINQQYYILQPKILKLNPVLILKDKIY